MNNSESNPISRRPAPLALVALLALLCALAIPAGAVAQDPSADQYSASSPSAGGATSDGDSSSSPPMETAAASAGANKAERDLANIAASAEQNRKGPGSAGADAGSATELLRSEGGSGPGMGLFLWIALGGTLLWAIGSGVMRHRQGGEPA